jgi:chorismate synthase
VISIRELSSLKDYADCVALQDLTWGEGFSERVPTAILRVSQMVGGVAAGAFDGEDRMLGFVFGLTGIRDSELVHWSDMLAVRPEVRGQGIGEKLKQYQRDKVSALGVRSMLWTFDPLQAGNANFNINHLGAMPIEYVVDMYGKTGATLHGTLPTDRFIVRWKLHGSERSLERTKLPIAANAIAMANTVDGDGVPSTALLPSTSPHAGPVSVQLPNDFTAMQQQDNSVALAWRLVVREVMTAWMGAGYRVAAFVRSDAAPYYRLEPTS